MDNILADHSYGVAASLPSKKEKYRHRRNVFIIFAIVFALGLLYQMHRMDALLHFSKWDNYSSADGFIVVPDIEDKKKLGKEQYLIVYDPTDVQSVLIQHNVAKILSEEKKEFQAVSMADSFGIDADCKGIIVATGKLSDVKGMAAIDGYVQKGGRALLLQRLVPENCSPEMLAKLGVSDLGTEANEAGLAVKSDFMLGVKGVSFDNGGYESSISNAVLLPSADVHMTTYAGTPMIWENGYGSGKYMIYNAMQRHDKTDMGVLTALLSNLHEDYIFPIMNSKIVFIDDFPAPTPKGRLESLYNEVHMDTEDFFRKLWWPEVQRLAREYDLKYTGLIIETYDNQVEGEFAPLSGKSARNSLVLYGRDLLNMGGELGIHGYNHQSLALDGYIKTDIGYNPWPSKEEMVKALKELNRYVGEVFPGYKLQSYVPPSNILSPEGHQALKEAFPHLKVYSSLFSGPADEDGYYQDFERNENGTFEIPRTSSGHKVGVDEMWSSYTAINYKGCFSHFIHPDEMYYEESVGLTWAIMKEGLNSFISETSERFGWMEANTASEAADKLDDLLDMDYRVAHMEDGNGMTIYAWNFRRPVSFVLRTDKEIAEVKGGKASKVQPNAYIVTVSEPEVGIYWKK